MQIQTNVSPTIASAPLPCPPRSEIERRQQCAGRLWTSALLRKAKPCTSQPSPPPPSRLSQSLPQSLPCCCTFMCAINSTGEAAEGDDERCTTLRLHLLLQPCGHNRLWWPRIRDGDGDGKETGEERNRIRNAPSYLGLAFHWGFPSFSVDRYYADISSFHTTVD